MGCSVAVGCIVAACPSVAVCRSVAVCCSVGVPLRWDRCGDGVPGREMTGREGGE